MPDLKLLGEKLSRHRVQLELSVEEVAVSTGLSPSLLRNIEDGLVEATGDQLLILADRYRCDYKHFLSNELLAPFEQTESLYRMYGSVLQREDRWAIQDLLYLCEIEAYLQEALNQSFIVLAPHSPKSDFKKREGWDVANHVRNSLGFQAREVSANPFQDFRRLGIHIFRRKLSNSNVSGIFIKHPIAGPCVLVNFEEDPYRQRFTLAHEAGHAIMDFESTEPLVSLLSEKADLREVRANAFASAYLLPNEFIKHIDINALTEESFLNVCSKCMVNAQTLCIALKERCDVSEEQLERFKNLRVSRSTKSDPELGSDLTPGSRARRERLLHHGLSYAYIRLCFDAHRGGIISLARLAECLLLDLNETVALMNSFSERPNFND